MKKKTITFAMALTFMSQFTLFPVHAENNMIYEAEDAAMTGTLENISESGASGGKVVGKFSESDDVLTFTVDIPANGSYDLIFNSMGYGGDKTNKVSIDGEYVGTFVTKADEYNDAVLSKVILTAGKHEVSITKSWGWIAVDYLKVQPAEAIPESAYQVSDTLSDKDATAETKALFSYLCKGYGEQVLSGQVADEGLQSDEFKAIYDVTGKKPAILGLDMMDYTPSRNALGAKLSEAVDRAIDFHEENGIITFCWHWNAPGSYIKSGTDEENGNPRWWGGFYTRNSTFDIEAVMNGTDPEGKEYLDKDIEGIAKQLNRLQEAGVPVLWRPLHEASGGWFWWGAKGADAYKKLYKYLYDQLTNKYGCHNLIWVWNGQNPDWYPGDEYVDIIGEDLYLDKHVYSASAAKFSEILEYSGGKKMIALTENGVVFDIDNVIAAGTKWAWFNTWNKSFITKNGEFSDEYTEAHILKKTYQSEYVITLDELPDWDTYTPGNTDPIPPVEEERIWGDANCDGKVLLNDAVLIMQSLGNPDVFGENGSDTSHITAEGMKNADVYDNGSGITNQDALQIQSYLLNMVETLEPDKK
ncbi:MAG: beta-mannosidase [Ruminococcus sp.]|nr:beta-mannosidase [Ruminococcus sp.]